MIFKNQLWRAIDSKHINVDLRYAWFNNGYIYVTNGYIAVRASLKNYGFSDYDTELLNNKFLSKDKLKSLKSFELQKINVHDNCFDAVHIKTGVKEKIYFDDVERYVEIETVINGTIERIKMQKDPAINKIGIDANSLITLQKTMEAPFLKLEFAENFNTVLATYPYEMDVIGIIHLMQTENL